MKTQISSDTSSSNKESFKVNSKTKPMDLIPLTDKNNDDNDDVQEMHLRALKICKDHLGGAWNKISPHEMCFTPISGGMSNALFCCSLPESMKVFNGEPNRVLLRLYGNKSKKCDISAQIEIFNLLSLNDLGPKLYGKFDDGRLEEFLPANSLTSEELMDPSISAIIAKKLAIVHSLNVPSIDRNKIWLVQRFKEWTKFISEQGETHFKLETMESTIKIAKELLAVDYNKEIKFLNGILKRTQSPIVFSHNDLHQGNILFAKHSKKRPNLEDRVVFIDFEYCSYNYRAYDIANHFCEWCFQYDTPEYPHFNFFENRFPDENIQREFVRNYLEQKKQLIHDNYDYNSCVSSSFGNPAKKHASIHGHSKNNQLNGCNHNYNDKTNNNNNNYDSHSFENNKPKPNGQLNGNFSGLSFENDNYFDNNNNNCYKSKGLLKLHKNGSYQRSLISNNSNGTNIEPQIDEINELYQEFQPFFMIANFLWALWCIKSAQTSNIKFGYWEHAMARWQLYRKFKSNYFEKMKTLANDNGINSKSRRID